MLRGCGFCGCTSKYRAIARTYRLGGPPGEIDDRAVLAGPAAGGEPRWGSTRPAGTGAPEETAHVVVSPVGPRASRISGTSPVDDGLLTRGVRL
ncbi:hypothetical protein GCM10025792_31670 [Pseudonocardia tropica]